MTEKERQALRAHLRVLGFVRVGYTDDLEGTGEYSEAWARASSLAGEGPTVVEIRWSKKVPS
jgi:hypothetical protein